MDRLMKFVESVRLAPNADYAADAIEEIFAQVAPLLRGFIQRRGPAGMEDDLLQEAALTICRSLGSFRGTTDAGFRAWCFQIARNLCHDEHRRRGRADSHLPNLEMDAELNGRGISAEDRTDLNDAVSLLRASQPECAELLWQRYVLEFDFKTLGDALGKTEDAARMNVNRCLEAARELFAKELR